MALIKSISGIRGTIGGVPNDNLTPVDIIKFSTAYAKWLKDRCNKKHIKVVVGRDSRISGLLIKNLVINTLLAMSIDVIDADLSTTPTMEMAVLFENADGGIIITASHNPKKWNALKLLNSKGEFLSKEDGELISKLSEQNIGYSTVDMLGKLELNNTFIKQHIDKILAYKWVDAISIRKRKLKVVVDGINSTGGNSCSSFIKRIRGGFYFIK